MSGARSTGREPKPIRLTNSLSGKKELLAPRVPGKLTFYSCGPTVYNLIHVGNLRGALVSDLAFRYFKRAGYDVTYVRNYTDVDDKIIDRAAVEKCTADEIAKKYIIEVEKDFAAARVETPSHKTLVTEHIPEIIDMISRIIARGKAYVAGGEVLFSIEAFEGYGKLSKRNIEDLVAGARVEVGAYKRNPLDFSLWKPAKPGEPSWPSPWGPGRPGWHIECSAMASKWLGDQIDVHHGGEDLIFPHHENEIAQSEAACGKAPFSQVWLHHAFVTVSKEKMSKSVGNVFSAREFLTRFGGEFARYFLLSAHYRSPLDFDVDLMEQSWTALHRLYEAKQKAVELTKVSRAMPDQRAEAFWGEFVASAERTRREIDEHFANDLNTAGALGAMFTLVREFNRTIAMPLAQATPSAILGAEQLIQIIEKEIGGVIGIGTSEPTAYLEQLKAIRIALNELELGSGAAAGVSSTATDRPTSAEIEGLIAERKAARAGKNFARADEIRKSLESRGVILKDSPQGTTWDFA